MTYEELFFKAKGAKSAEEIFTIASANGMKITEEQAKNYFEQINKKGALDDDELDVVSGGGCSNGGSPASYDPIPPYATHVYILNGCPECGEVSGFVCNEDENNWEVVCNEKCPKHLKGSGRKSFWEQVKFY